MDNETLEALLHPDPWTPKPLTPYDTGARLEPQLWVDPDKLDADATHDEFGKVDFDNEEGGTAATVWFDRNPVGGYTLHLQANAPIYVKWEE